MSGAQTPIDAWPDRLESLLSRLGGRFDRVRVLSETASTQDAARRLGGAAGLIVVAGRQTAGRGRHARRWHDTADDGVAVTMGVAAGAPERLAVAAAVGAAGAAEHFLGRAVGIKWPNDIVVEGRKLAGLLIEIHQSAALIGVGLNVRQRSWPRELEPQAVSLAQLGVDADRIEVIESIIARLDEALDADTHDLAEAFAGRDVLAGTEATFRHDNRVISGTVRAVDPMRGLSVETPDGLLWLGATATTRLPVAGGSSSSTGPAGPRNGSDRRV